MHRADSLSLSRSAAIQSHSFALVMSLLRRAASAVTQTAPRGLQSGAAAAVSCTRITAAQTQARQSFAAPAFSSSRSTRAPTAAATAAASAPSASSSPSSSLSKFTSIPVIDLSGTFGTGPEVAARRAAVAKLIDQAAREVGFFTIVGHGLDERMVSDVWKITQSYFDLPVEAKNKILMDKDYPYGYSGFGGESLAKGYGEAGRPDPKECFAIGPYNPKAGMTAVRWPSEPKEFERLWLQYYQSMEGLAGHLLSLFAQALDLPQDWFAAKIDRHRSALRALNYPKLDKALAAGEVRAGAHTDYGSLTILLQDSTGGLQVRNRAKQWVDATPRANSFVINLGDLMARWTNDRWVSTLHRVVQPPQAAKLPPARRQSMAFFHNVNHDQIIECIPTCASPSNPPKYEPIAAWDLLMQKHLSATTY